MKEKMRKVRYPMLIVWGIFMGAAGTAGVKSSWHVIPGWLIGVIVILGIMVMLTWMISGKNDKSIKKSLWSWNFGENEMVLINLE